MKGLQLLGALALAGVLFVGLFQPGTRLTEGDQKHVKQVPPAVPEPIILPHAITRDTLIGEWTRVGSRMGAPIPGRPEKTLIKTLVIYEPDGTLHGRTWVTGATNKTEAFSAGRWTLTGNTLSITDHLTNSLTSTLTITNNLLQSYTEDANLYVYYQKLR